MSEQSVARQYAHALFQVADRSGRVADIGRDLAQFAQFVQAHPDLTAIFATPLVIPKKKRALVDALVARSTDLAPEVSRMLELLADRDRLMLLGDVAAAYAARVMAAEKVVEADVVTAVPLGTARESALVLALGKATGRKVILKTRVDPAIVGGVVAKVGTVVFDGSVVRQIERLRQQLLAEA